MDSIITSLKNLINETNDNAQFKDAALKVLNVLERKSQFHSLNYLNMIDIALSFENLTNNAKILLFSLFADVIASHVPIDKRYIVKYGFRTTDNGNIKNAESRSITIFLQRCNEFFDVVKKENDLTEEQKHILRLLNKMGKSIGIIYDEKYSSILGLKKTPSKITEIKTTSTTDVIFGPSAKNNKPKKNNIDLTIIKEDPNESALDTTVASTNLNKTYADLNETIQSIRENDN
jgi:hypothetical protein